MSSGNISTDHVQHYVRAALSHTPVTATRMGVLTMIRDALAGTEHPAIASELERTAAPLARALDVDTLDEVDAAMRALRGRPPIGVTRALASAEFVTVLVDSLDVLGWSDLAAEAARWGARNPRNPLEALPLAGDARARRAELLDQLRQRAGELLAGWRKAEAVLNGDSVFIDGRSLSAAARAWQIPMITGEVLERPTATAVLHPNRLGRTAAIVAFAQLRTVVRSSAPDAVIFETLALLVAVGESITRWTPSGEQKGFMVWDSSTATAAVRGELPVYVRVGEPVDAGSADLAMWWPAFSAWGATSKRAATAMPTAWKLSEVEADVLVWVLCSCAARLGVAGSMPELTRATRSWRSQMPVTWEQHCAEEMRKWEAGARSVWALMQSVRRFETRTGYPEASQLWSLDDVTAWPWYSADQ